MKASELIKRGRSLSDLDNSKFISTDDEINSLNESYRDVYSAITNSDDDYYLLEEEITLIPSMVKDEYTYIVPMPVDMYKIRFVDFKGSTSMWEKVPRFSMESRNGGQGTFAYRMQNNNLWLTGKIASASGGVVRISYYPPPAIMSAPTQSFTYNEITPIYSRTAINYPCYVETEDTCIYNLGLTIVAESNTQMTTTTLHTSATAITGIQYNKGYIYWLTNGLIYRAPTNLTAVLVPALISPVGETVTNFRVYNDMIYYCLATNNTYSMNLDGSSDTLVLASASIDYTLYDNTPIWVAGNLLVVNGVATIIPANHIISTGDYIYTLYSNSIYRITLDGTDIDENYYIVDDISCMNQISFDKIGVVIYSDYGISCISANVDSDFDYPLNEVPEIIAYQLASDFYRKQQKDATTINNRLQELWTRYIKTVKRDEYQVEIVGNYYNNIIPNQYR